ncbi:hypothetical protein, partial [Congregibacter sp.]|uniref:hypothetical protein n=1 Tax=Congregibacter sp. TaxID=2744308 RepID=UPI0039E46D25
IMKAVCSVVVVYCMALFAMPSHADAETAALAKKLQEQQYEQQRKQNDVDAYARLLDEYKIEAWLSTPGLRDDAQVFFESAARNARHGMDNADVIQLLRTSGSGLTYAKTTLATTKPKLAGTGNQIPFMKLIECEQAVQIWPVFADNPRKAGPAVFEKLGTAVGGCETRLQGSLAAYEFLSKEKRYDPNAAKFGPQEKVADTPEQKLEKDNRSITVKYGTRTQRAAYRFEDWEYHHLVAATNVMYQLRSMLARFGGLGGNLVYAASYYQTLAEKEFNEITGAPYSQRAATLAKAENSALMEAQKNRADAEQEMAVAAALPLPTEPYKYDQQERKMIIDFMKANDVGCNYSKHDQVPIQQYVHLVLACSMIHIVQDPNFHAFGTRYSGEFNNRK